MSVGCLVLLIAREDALINLSSLPSSLRDTSTGFIVHVNTPPLASGALTDDASLQTTLTAAFGSRAASREGERPCLLLRMARLQ